MEYLIINEENYMKIAVYTLIFCFCNISLKAQFNCNEDSVMAIVGKWKKGTDANMVKSKNLPHINSRLLKISTLFQQAYPQPMATQPMWWGGMKGVPIIEGGPIAYYFGSLYFAWFCNENLQKLMFEEETGNHAHVFINDLGSFFSQNITLREVKVNGEDVYILPEPTGEFKGYKVYDEGDKNFGGRTIILAHNNRPPWKAITQSQYLFSLKAVWQNKIDKGVKEYAAHIADLNKMIKEYEKNTLIKPEDKKSIIASLEKNIEDAKKEEPEFKERLTTLFAERIAVIDKYVSEFKQELNKPAILDNEEVMDDFKGKFSKSEFSGNSLVVIDPDYFNKNLPDFVPQLMLLDLSWHKNSKAGLYFIKQIEENFPIEKLQEMIDK